MAASEGQAFLFAAGRGGTELLALEAERLPDAAASHPRQPILEWMDWQLLDAYQRDFPICERPFAAIASRLDCPSSEVLQRFAVLLRRGVVRRIGPVFAPGRLGPSTLAAMSVPSARLDWVAEWVNRYQGVDHTCEREHELNLWFVLTTRNAGELYDVLGDIRRRTGLDVLDLRLERAYDVDNESPPGPLPPSGRLPATWGLHSPERGPRLDACDQRLVGAIRGGLSLTARPYRVVADRIGLSEAQVMERLRRLRCEGVIAHMGVVVGHHELGCHASAMVVFDVPRARVDTVGERLTAAAPLSRCYRRTRRPPFWPYNLYCTLHGRDRDEVMSRVDELLPVGAGDIRRTVLFGRRRFRPAPPFTTIEPPPTPRPVRGAETAGGPP